MIFSLLLVLFAVNNVQANDDDMMPMQYTPDCKCRGSNPNRPCGDKGSACLPSAKTFNQTACCYYVVSGPQSNPIEECFDSPPEITAVDDLEPPFVLPKCRCKSSLSGGDGTVACAECDIVSRCSRCNAGYHLDTEYYTCRPGEKGDDKNAPSGGTGSLVKLVFILVLVVLLIVGGVVGFFWFRKRQQETTFQAY